MNLNKKLNLQIADDKKEAREGFGIGLIEAAIDNRVVALTADLAPSVKMDAFKKQFPTRYFDVGVAEQNLVTVAAGLAHIGKIPFVSAFGAFMPGRCWEQIRTAICYNQEKVNIVASHCGISVGPDGATHQVLEDIAMMRSLPNMVVVSPCDFSQAKLATKAMAKDIRACYMRYGRGKIPQITTQSTDFEIGKAQIFQDGVDVAIIACGACVYDALAATDLLKGKTSVRVINMHTIKPIDIKAIVDASKQCGKIITVEDHQIAGGLGSAVCEVVARHAPCKVFRLGVNDMFGESGSSDELFAKHGINAEGIAKAVKQITK